MEGNTVTQNYIDINCHGTAVSMYTHFKPAQGNTNNITGQYYYQNTLTIVNTIFHNHAIVSDNCTQKVSQGALYVGTVNSDKLSQVVILLHNVMFHKNVARHSGTAIYMYAYHKERNTL